MSANETSTLGKALKNARESKGLSVEYVADHLKIRSLYLRALESMEFQKIPGEVYIIGFIRTYGRFLELNEDKLIALYRLEAKGFRPSKEFPVPIVMHESHLPKKWVVSASAITFAIFFSIYLFSNSRYWASNISSSGIVSPTQEMLAIIGEGELAKSIKSSGKVQECRADDIKCIDITPLEPNISMASYMQNFCVYNFNDFMLVLIEEMKERQMQTSTYPSTPWPQ